MRSVHCGDIQGREWLSAVLPVLSGQVQYIRGSDLRGDVQRVPHAHVLTRRQLDADQLYLQQGVHRARWDTMRSVHRGDIQGREWLSAVLPVH